MKIYEVRTVYQSKRREVGDGAEDRADDIMLSNMIAVQSDELNKSHRGVSWKLAGVVLCHEYKYRLIFEGTTRS